MQAILPGVFTVFTVFAPGHHAPGFHEAGQAVQSPGSFPLARRGGALRE